MSQRNFAKLHIYIYILSEELNVDSLQYYLLYFLLCLYTLYPKVLVEVFRFLHAHLFADSKLDFVGTLYLKRFLNC